MRIRAVQACELPILQEIERAAGQPFADIGMVEIAQDEPYPLAVLAATDGLAALTLTTFASVPWNAPYYRRCGFRVLDEAELTPGLRAIRQHEAGLGLDKWPRVCMRRDL